MYWWINFNPPTPCGVGQCRHTRLSFPLSFQSTHSMRSGTNSIYSLVSHNQFQSTHSMRSGTFFSFSFRLSGSFQSTHSMRSGTPTGIRELGPRPFQSTHSMRSGTLYRLCNGIRINISIHPLHAEWDSSGIPEESMWKYFNPPTPCGVGHGSRPRATACLPFQSTHSMRSGTAGHVIRDVVFQFQSTHSMRSGTQHQHISVHVVFISIHPLHAEWDGSCSVIATKSANFNPPTPCGVGQYCGNIKIQ